MKVEIAEAARKLLMEKKVKKLTVKDIVDECHITRQAFYYHFEDIPDMFRWVLEKGAQLIREAGLGKEMCIRDSYKIDLMYDFIQIFCILFRPICQNTHYSLAVITQNKF